MAVNRPNFDEIFNNLRTKLAGQIRNNYDQGMPGLMSRLYGNDQYLSSNFGSNIQNYSNQMSRSLSEMDADLSARRALMEWEYLQQQEQQRREDEEANQQALYEGSAADSLAMADAAQQQRERWQDSMKRQDDWMKGNASGYYYGGKFYAGGTGPMPGGNPQYSTNVGVALPRQTGFGMGNPFAMDKGRTGMSGGFGQNQGQMAGALGQALGGGRFGPTAQPKKPSTYQIPNPYRPKTGQSGDYSAPIRRR